MESHLHYLWKFRLYHTPLFTSNGDAVQVLDPGQHNNDAGPDFFNAKIMIGSTLWAGNVEIHTRSSDWYRHTHDTDPAYNSVILHVVGQNDREVFNQKGDKITQLLLPLQQALSQEIEYFLHPDTVYPCSGKVKRIPSLVISAFLNRLATERLESRVAEVKHLLDHTKGDWEGVLFIRLLRAFGMGINGDAFERLGRTIPFRIIMKHHLSLFELEALLLGTAGFLSHPLGSNEYQRRLSEEFAYLRHKYELNIIDEGTWRMARLRPSNFPHLRLAQAAAIYHRNQRLFRSVTEAESREEVLSLLEADPSEYWHSHYSFSEAQHEHSGVLGRSTKESIQINAIIPILFAYGKETDNPDLCEKAFDLLASLRPETNRHTRCWQSLGVECKDAMESQALLHLNNTYCMRKRCLYCNIGNKLLSGIVKG